MYVADAEAVYECVGGRHRLCGQKKESGINKTDRDCDLEEVEESRPLHRLPLISVGEEEHHHDGSAVEAIEQDPSGLRQRRLAEESVVGKDDVGNEQSHERGTEEKPEQGGRTAGAAERDPGASDGERILQDDNQVGDAAGGLAGSQSQIAGDLRDHQGGK